MLGENKYNRVLIGASVGNFNHIDYYKMLINKGVDYLVPHFFISGCGKVTKIVDENIRAKYSTFTNIDYSSISIELETLYVDVRNQNIETQQPIKTIYKEMVNRFRGNNQHTMFSQEQITSLELLVEDISIKHKIPIKYPNTLDVGVLNNSIIYRPNLSLVYDDIKINIYETRGNIQRDA